MPFNSGAGFRSPALILVTAPLPAIKLSSALLVPLVAQPVSRMTDEMIARYFFILFLGE